MDKLSDNIRNKLNNIPRLPGIYKMLDSKGKVIYVGKSKCLRNRVRSYFSGNHKWSKVEKMVQLINDIEYKVTDTHLEARLEECKLIKEQKPIFNSQLKNDVSYVYLKVEDKNMNKPLSVVYTREKNSYGPFRARFAIQEFTRALENIYPITKTGNDYAFTYKIFPVEMDKTSYNMNKKILNEIFKDEKNLLKFKDKLDKNMKEAASNLQFERATYYRNLIHYLNIINNGLNAYRNLYIKNILLKLETENGYKLFYINKGEILYKKSYTSISNRDIDTFIKVSKSIVNPNQKEYDEKSDMDFKDIVYSEINSLPIDKVFYLD